MAHCVPNAPYDAATPSRADGQQRQPGNQRQRQLGEARRAAVGRRQVIEPSRSAPGPGQAEGRVAGDLGQHVDRQPVIAPQHRLKLLMLGSSSGTLTAVIVPRSATADPASAANVLR